MRKTNEVTRTDVAAQMAEDELMDKARFRDERTAHQRRSLRAIAKHRPKLLKGHKCRAGKFVIGDATLSTLILEDYIKYDKGRVVPTPRGMNVVEQSH